MSATHSPILRFRASRLLIAALDDEARRRGLRRSSVIKEILATELSRTGAYPPLAPVARGGGGGTDS